MAVPFHKARLAGKTTHAAWRSKPSYCAVSTEDRTIKPDSSAKRMGAKTIDVKASHLSLISHPEEIARLILEAAGHQILRQARPTYPPPSTTVRQPMELEHSTLVGGFVVVGRGRPGSSHASPD